MACGHTDVRITERIFRNGTHHLEKRCKKCDKHLGYKAHKGKSGRRIHFGKYSGQTFKVIAENDPDYLDWMRNQPWCKSGLKADIDQALINQLMPTPSVVDVEAENNIREMRRLGLEYFIQINKNHESTDIRSNTSIHREKAD